MSYQFLLGIPFLEGRIRLLLFSSYLYTDVLLFTPNPPTPSFPRRFSAVKCWRWKTGVLFLERRSTDGGHIMRGSLVPLRVTWLFNPIISYGLFTRKQFVCLLHGTLGVNPREKMCRFKEGSHIGMKDGGSRTMKVIIGERRAVWAFPNELDQFIFEAKAWMVVCKCVSVNCFCKDCIWLVIFPVVPTKKLVGLCTNGWQKG